MAEKLIDKHQQRAEAAAEQIEPEALRRLFFFLIDTVLERPAQDLPKVVSLGLPITSIVSA